MLLFLTILKNLIFFSPVCIYILLFFCSYFFTNIYFFYHLSLLWILGLFIFFSIHLISIFWTISLSSRHFYNCKNCLEIYNSTLNLLFSFNEFLSNILVHCLWLFRFLLLFLATLHFVLAYSKRNKQNTLLCNTKIIYA